MQALPLLKAAGFEEMSANGEELCGRAAGPQSASSEGIHLQVPCQHPGSFCQDLLQLGRVHVDLLERVTWPALHRGALRQPYTALGQPQAGLIFSHGLQEFHDQLLSLLEVVGACFQQLCLPLRFGRWCGGLIAGTR